MEQPSYFSFWAKTDQSGSEKIHPLIYHLIDVGECTLALWKHAFSQQTRQTFTGFLDLEPEATGRLLAFWASLHDLGKAAPGFQRKYLPRIPVLDGMGFVFPKDVSPNPVPHGILSAWALTDLLQECGLTKSNARQIAFALGGHHGAWPTNDRFSPTSLKSSDKGEGLWDTARKDLLLALKEVYQPANIVSLPKAQEERNAFLTLFSGLVSVADWLGSMSENFPFTEEYLPAGEYAERVAHKAMDALNKLGWMGWQAEGNLLAFAAMFPNIQTPNDIQQKTFEDTKGIKLPALVILEAPTGIGKTEAALYLADTWLQGQKGRGLYIAMPTQATSNQMFERVVEFLQSRYTAQSINAHLVHGAALLEDDEETPQPQGIAQDDKAAEGNVKAETWFLPRKRTLLAPFGVGTVDQALMSVLQTNHFFVRLFGLGQKVVVFDEVHAYDTYMSTLFQRLLRWLRSIGTSVILLSATLPEKTRKELAGAWLGKDEAALPPAEYPRMTMVSGEKVDSVPLPPPESHILQLTWADSTPEQAANHLAEKLKDGGCAAVICNRVKRAQEVYAAIKARGIIEGDKLILFHARFPFVWRKDIEDCVLKIFGKNKEHPDQPNPHRPQKAIVVATQVIEQSLDLDFDYMLTDLAPIDLLLQRAGRLHRHKQNNVYRPEGLKHPVIAIALPAEKNGLPDFGLDDRVYDKATLLCTWLTLHERERLILPEETSKLIEAVYGDVHEEDLPANFVQAFRQAREDARLSMEKEIYEAKQRLIAKPDYEDLLTDHNEVLEEDNPKVNDAFRALTRLAEPSVTLICLHETAQGIALESDGTGAPIDVSKRPDLKQAKELLKRAVGVQRRDVVNYFVKNVKMAAGWRESAAVRYHYPVKFDQNGECNPVGADFTLKLTHELGLEVIKKEDK